MIRGAYDRSGHTCTKSSRAWAAGQRAAFRAKANPPTTKGGRGSPGSCDRCDQICHTRGGCCANRRSRTAGPSAGRPRTPGRANAIADTWHRKRARPNCFRTVSYIVEYIGLQTEAVFRITFCCQLATSGKQRFDMVKVIVLGTAPCTDGVLKWALEACMPVAATPGMVFKLERKEPLVVDRVEWPPGGHAGFEFFTDALISGKPVPPHAAPAPAGLHFPATPNPKPDSRLPTPDARCSPLLSQRAAWSCRRPPMPSRRPRGWPGRAGPWR